MYLFILFSLVFVLSFTPLHVLYILSGLCIVSVYVI